MGAPCTSLRRSAAERSCLSSRTCPSLSPLRRPCPLSASPTPSMVPAAATPFTKEEDDKPKEPYHPRQPTAHEFEKALPTSRNQQTNSASKLIMKTTIG